MNNLMERSKAPNVVNSVAVTRALAKARLGDEQALRWLVDQRTAGNPVAAKALDEYRRNHFKLS